MEWYLEVLKKYAKFTGRARRKEYWMFALVHLAIAFGLLFIVGAVSEGLGAALYWLYLVGTFVPALAVSVRRLHDTGRSGWWMLISLIPFGGLVLLFFLASRGETGPNAYGPDPKFATV